MLDRIIEEAPRFFTYYNLIFLGQAAMTTLALTAVGCLGGFFFGFMMAAVRQTRSGLAWPLRALAFLVTELFRRIPFLVTLFIFFYTFEVLDLNLSVFWVATTAVVVIAAAFIAEIVRAGFESVHQNQWDAAAAMNFSLPMTLRYVVLPQAWKVILPPAFSFFILFIKDTALASPDRGGGAHLCRKGSEQQGVLGGTGLRLDPRAVLRAVLSADEARPARGGSPCRTLISSMSPPLTSAPACSTACRSVWTRAGSSA